MPECDQQLVMPECDNTSQKAALYLMGFRHLWCESKGDTSLTGKKQTFFQGCDVIVIRNYDVSQLMKLVWEIQTYPVINFPKKVAGQVRDINQNQKSAWKSLDTLFPHCTLFHKFWEFCVG